VAGTNATLEQVQEKQVLPLPDSANAATSDGKPKINAG